MYIEKYDWWLFMALLLIILNISGQKHVIVFHNHAAPSQDSHRNTFETGLEEAWNPSICEAEAGRLSKFIDYIMGLISKKRNWV